METTSQFEIWSFLLHLRKYCSPKELLEFLYRRFTSSWNKSANVEVPPCPNTYATVYEEYEAKRKNIRENIGVFFSNSSSFLSQVLPLFFYDTIFCFDVACDIASAYYRIANDVIQRNARS